MVETTIILFSVVFDCSVSNLIWRLCEIDLWVLKACAYLAESDFWEADQNGYNMNVLS